MWRSIALSALRQAGSTHKDGRGHLLDITSIGEQQSLLATHAGTKSAQLRRIAMCGIEKKDSPKAYWRASSPRVTTRPGCVGPNQGTRSTSDSAKNLARSVVKRTGMLPQSDMPVIHKSSTNNTGSGGTT